MQTKVIDIDLGDRSYQISIGSGISRTVQEFLPVNIEGAKVYLVTDENVYPYADTIRNELLNKGASFAEILSFKPGESTKSYENLMRVHDWMLKNNINRNSLVLAVGGGVIGDLAGFAAATILRGVPYVQIPTSLLAQVDSSVGGKTGINTEHGKNLVGNFYQPISVIADIKTLETLPRRELLAGYSEIVKYGLISNRNFFEWLEANGSRVIDLEEDAVAEAVEVSCKAKASIVEADEKESGQRALLNLGHTFAHALEAMAGYDGSLLHGEAVSIGMVMAFDLSVDLDLCDKSEAERVRGHLSSAGLPTNASQIDAQVDDLIAIMRRDKKVKDDKMTFILARGIGDAFVTQDVHEDKVRNILAQSLAGGNK